CLLLTRKRDHKPVLQSRCSVASYVILPCFFTRYGDHRDVHSFPTRRSSDLRGQAWLKEKRPWFSSSTPRPPHCGQIEGLEENQEIGRAHVELQSRGHLVCRLLLEKKKTTSSPRSPWSKERARLAAARYSMPP